MLNKSITLQIKLKENNKLLGTVQIKEKPDPNRAKYLEIFKKKFIGESINASQCRILNPDVISFHYDETTKTLTASADDLLEIENLGLGYKLKYLLVNFRVDFQNYRCYYSGSPYFEELKGSPEQQKIWEESRKLAYAGSMRNFFRDVFRNTASADGFKVFSIVDKRVGKRIKKVVKEFTTDSLFTTISPDFKKLRKPFEIITAKDTTQLFVVYRNSFVPTEFFQTVNIELPIKFSRRQDQLSKIVPMVEDILVDRNGELTPPASFLISGYWPWQRIAELTPIDYGADFERGYY